MKKRTIWFMIMVTVLSIILTQLSYADIDGSQNRDSSKQASNAIFDWKTDKSHLSGDYNSIVFGKGVYVAVGRRGIISVSKDLKKWESVSFPDYDFGMDKEAGFQTVLFNGEVFVAAGGRAVTYSSDGYSWKKVNVEYDEGKPIGFALSDDAIIKYGQTKGKNFVLTGTGVMAYSPDGINWKNREGVSVNIESGGMSKVGSFFSNTVYDGHKLATICTNWLDDYGNKKYSVYTSTDGLDWEETETYGLNNNYGDILSYFEGKYYISYYLNKRITMESENLMDWEQSQEDLDNICYSIDNITYKLGDGIYRKKDTGFVALYRAGGTASDTVSDNPVSIGTAAVSGSPRLNGLCKGDGKLVAVGTEGLIVICDTNSRSGWKPAEIRTFKSIYAAAAGKSCIVAVGKDGQIIKSKDGLDWAAVKTNITQTLHSVLYDGKSFVAAGDKGTIAISETGDSWRIIPLRNQEDLTSVKKINGMYFAVGRGVILTSKNAASWSPALVTNNDIQLTNAELSSVAYRAGVYYLVSRGNSYVYCSKNGTKWEKTFELKDYDFSDLCFYKGRFILLGRNMAVSKDMKSYMITGAGAFSYDKEPYKINAFNDFLLTGNINGNIYYSPDGLVWNIAGKLDTFDCVNAFTEFKGNYYGFTTNGNIIKGTKKGKIPAVSDITADFLYDYPDIDNDSSNKAGLANQPAIKGNTVMMTIEAVSKIIGADCSYDRSKKTAEINLGKKNVKFSINSSYITANGKKIKTPQKVYASGNSVYVPAGDVFDSLGYKFGYDSFYRRIYVTVNDVPKNSPMSYKPANFGKIGGSIYIQAIGYNKDIFVAVSDRGVIYNSKDGNNWLKAAEIKEYAFSKLLWNGKRFILTGITGVDANTETSVIYVSEDGVKWRKVDGAPAIKYICDGTVGAGGRTAGEAYTGNELKQTVLVDSEGSVLTSGDGLVWTKTLEGQPWNYSHVCWYKGTYFISGWYSGKVYTSADGLTWSPYGAKAIINKLICSGDSLWAVEAYGDNNNSSKLYRSSNGKDWSYITDIPKKSIDKIIYTGRKYILIGNKNSENSVSKSAAYLMESKDGDLWEYSEADKNMEFANDILHYDKFILAATGKGVIILSEK